MMMKTYLVMENNSSSRCLAFWGNNYFLQKNKRRLLRFWTSEYAFKQYLTLPAEVFVQLAPSVKGSVGQYVYEMFMFCQLKPPNIRISIFTLIHSSAKESEDTNVYVIDETLSIDYI